MLIFQYKLIPSTFVYYVYISRNGKVKWKYDLLWNFLILTLLWYTIQFHDLAGHMSQQTNLACFAIGCTFFHGRSFIDRAISMNARWWVNQISYNKGTFLPSCFPPETSSSLFSYWHVGQICSKLTSLKCDFSLAAEWVHPGQWFCKFFSPTAPSKSTSSLFGRDHALNGQMSHPSYWMSVDISNRTSNFFCYLDPSHTRIWPRIPTTSHSFQAVEQSPAPGHRQPRDRWWRGRFSKASWKTVGVGSLSALWAFESPTQSP